MPHPHRYTHPPTRTLLVDRVVDGEDDGHVLLLRVEALGLHIEVVGWWVREAGTHGRGGLDSHAALTPYQCIR